MKRPPSRASAFRRFRKRIIPKKKNLLKRNSWKISGPGRPGTSGRHPTDATPRISIYVSVRPHGHALHHSPDCRVRDLIAFSGRISARDSDRRCALHTRERGLTRPYQPTPSLHVLYHEGQCSPDVQRHGATERQRGRLAHGSTGAHSHTAAYGFAAHRHRLHLRHQWYPQATYGRQLHMRRKPWTAHRAHAPHTRQYLISDSHIPQNPQKP